MAKSVIAYNNEVPEIPVVFWFLERFLAGTFPGSLSRWGHF